MNYENYKKIEEIFSNIYSNEELEEYMSKYNYSDNSKEKIRRLYYIYKTDVWNGFIRYNATDTLVINGDNIKDIVNNINNNPNYNMYYILLDNKSYDDLELLYTLPQDKVFISYDEKYLYCSIDEFIGMRSTIDYYKNLVEENDLSPLEKIAYIYDLIKSMKYEESDTKLISRELHSIVSDGKIVCVGYAKFISQILSEFGMESYYLTVCKRNNPEEKHLRLAIKVQDEKYGINDIFAFDPTFDNDHGLKLCEDENGNNVYRQYDDPVKPEDKIIKEYDGLILYRYFLISIDDYSNHFKKDRIVDIQDRKSKKIGTPEQWDAISFGNLKTKIIDKDLFIRLMCNIKPCEGYEIDTLPELIRDLFKINFSMDVEKEYIEKIMKQELGSKAK